MKKQNLTDAVRVIPVVVIHDLAQTVPTLEALRDGGIPAAEITFRTPCAAEAIRIGREQFPEMHIGAVGGAQEGHTAVFRERSGALGGEVPKTVRKHLERRGTNPGRRQ